LHSDSLPPLTVTFAPVGLLTSWTRASLASHGHSFTPQANSHCSRRHLTTSPLTINLLLRPGDRAWRLFLGALLRAVNTFSTSRLRERNNSNAPIRIIGLVGDYSLRILFVACLGDGPACCIRSTCLRRDRISTLALLFHSLFARARLRSCATCSYRPRHRRFLLARLFAALAGRHAWCGMVFIAARAFLSSSCAELFATLAFFFVEGSPLCTRIARCRTVHYTRGDSKHLRRASNITLPCCNALGLVGSRRHTLPHSNTLRLLLIRFTYRGPFALEDYLRYRIPRLETPVATPSRDFSSCALLFLECQLIVTIGPIATRE